MIKKTFFFLFLTLFSMGTLAETTDQPSMSSAQKWVLGITGGALLATGAATHQQYAQEPRKIIALIGLATFAGVTIYEENKRGKNEKIVFSMNGENPSLAFIKTF